MVIVTYMGYRTALQQEGDSEPLTVKGFVLPLTPIRVIKKNVFTIKRIELQEVVVD